MNKTKIPWCDYTWNVVTGCDPISEGCEHCYCRAMEKRFKWPTAVTLHPERLEEPLRIKGPARVFVCSMADLFHPEVPFDFIAKVWQVMWAAPGLIFQILTKRPERMLEFLTSWYKAESRHPARQDDFFGHVWLGVTAENQRRADERIPLLLQTPPAVRFVSVEPMLRPVSLGFYLPNPPGKQYILLDGSEYTQRLDWVIAGCESGPSRRPARLDWFLHLRDQCVAAGIPFFLKQMEDQTDDHPVEHLPELDGRQWLQFPEVCA